MRFHIVFVFCILAASAFALPSESLRSDSWEETSTAVDVADEADEAHEIAHAMAERAAKQFIENFSKLTDDDLRRGIRKSFEKNGLHHYKYVDVEVEALLPNMKQICDQIKAWLAKTPNPFAGMAAYLAAFVYDSIKGVVNGFKTAAAKLKIALNNNKAAIDFAQEKQVTALVKDLHAKFCDAIGDFLLYAASYNPAGATTVQAMKFVDNAASAVASIAGGASKAAGWIGLGQNSQAITQAIQNKAEKVKIEAALRQTLCGISENYFCTEGEKMGKTMALTPSTWKYKQMTGQALLFVENYLCIDERMTPCMANLKKAASMKDKAGKPMITPAQLKNSECTCWQVNGPKQWVSLADAVANMIDRNPTDAQLTRPNAQQQQACRL